VKPLKIQSSKTQLLIAAFLSVGACVARAAEQGGESGGITHDQIAQLLSQMIAFAIAFFVLKKYAWGPILNLLDERKKGIAADYDAVAKKHEEVDSLRKELELRLRNMDAESRARINEAIAEGKKIAEEVADRARSDAREMTDKAKRAMELEVEKARLQLRDDVVRLTIGATEKLLQERLDDPKHRQLVNEFIERLAKN